MEQIITIVNMTARFVAILGGALTAIFVVYSGILWITAAGDPQKIMAARNALMGCVVGVIIIGMGFMIPGVISRWIIQPAGGLTVDAAISVDCDRMLREQLVYQRNARDAAAMQNLVYRVQLRNDGHCSRALWSPVISSANYHWNFGCHDDANKTIGVVRLPDAFISTTDNPTILAQTKRLRDGHILVIFELDSPTTDSQPADGAICWFYHAEFEVWASGYATGTPTPY